MLSSSTPIDLSLYHHVDYPTQIYSTHEGASSRDVLLHLMLVIEIVHR